MAKKKAKKKATKGSARKSLKLRKKPLRDLPAKKKSMKVKGGADISLSPSQQAALKSQLQTAPANVRSPLRPGATGLCRIHARPSLTPDARTMSRVRLISMPWDQLEHPPIQLAILQAVLERDGIDAEVHCLGLDFLDHCIALTADRPPDERLGVVDYDLVVELSRDVGLGDWIFAESTEDNDAGYVRWLSEHPVAEHDIEVARRFRALVPSFLDRWAETLAAAAPAVVGFTTGADQTAASLALARRLKARRPDVHIVFGGANCQGVMGAALHRAFPWVDAVVRGEGERVLPGLVKDLLAGGPCRPQPGLCYRDGERSVAVAEGGDPVALDDGPVPRYDAYFARLAASPAAAGSAPRDSCSTRARAGAGGGRARTARSAAINDQALSLPEQAARARRARSSRAHPRATTRRESWSSTTSSTCATSARCCPTCATRGAGLRMFCETKANITKADVRLLREAGSSRSRPASRASATRS